RARGRPRPRPPRHQSTFTSVEVGALTPKYCSKTLSAAGAAALEPWPPFSMSAQTTSRAESEGPQPHHHDWSSRGSLGDPRSGTTFSAVPVSPEIGTGAFLNTPAEVPVAEWVPR